MCGIVGFTGENSSSQLSRMNRLIEHRGPDDFGEFSDSENQVHLAMRRLSILDLEGGHQPMFNDDKSIWIVFNGEIFNAPTLRKELEATGSRFQTNNSDTEVILRLYEKEGTHLVHKLNGMFAFVIYDKNHKRLIGARDPFGIKPLYYHLSKNKNLLFSSEIKPLLEVLPSFPQIDNQSLLHYLSLQFVPGENSIFQGIQRVPPGTQFTFCLRSKKLNFEPFFQFPETKTNAYSEEEWSNILEHELKEAVQRWSLSDVPIACSLSGGLDSSIIVAMLSEHTQSPVHTFTLGFENMENPKLDERHLASLVSQKYGTQHHEIVLKPEMLLDELISMAWFLEEPYGGGLPSWYVFKAIGTEFKVGMTGSGGDELFGNYGKFEYYQKPNPGATWFATHSQLSSFPGGNRLLKYLTPSFSHYQNNDLLTHTRDRLTNTFGYFHHFNDYYFSDAQKASFLSSDFSNCNSTNSFMQKEYQRLKQNDLTNSVAMVDLTHQLPEEFLLMTDRFSMGHHVEARVPMLDLKFANLALSMPSNMRCNSGYKKKFMRTIAHRLLPEELLQSGKRGFVLPIQSWLRKELKPLMLKLLGKEHLKKQGIFSEKIATEYVTPFLEGKRDCAHPLWTLVMFQIWHQIYIQNHSIQRPSFTYKDL